MNSTFKIQKRSNAVNGQRLTVNGMNNWTFGPIILNFVDRSPLTVNRI